MKILLFTILIFSNAFPSNLMQIANNKNEERENKPSHDLLCDILWQNIHGGKIVDHKTHSGLW